MKTKTIIAYVDIFPGWACCDTYIPYISQNPGSPPREGTTRFRIEIDLPIIEMAPPIAARVVAQQ